MSKLHSQLVASGIDKGRGRGPEDGAAKKPMESPPERRPQRYDDLAGATLLRRTGRAATAKPARGGGESALLRGKGDTQTQIGQQLRTLYDAVLTEPVPDRFVELLAELERKP